MRHGNRCGPQVLVPPFMSGQFHAAQSPPPCLPSPCAPLPCLPPPCAPPPCVESIFRSSAGGAARQRRRRPAPRQYHTAASPRTEIPEHRHRSSVHLTRSSPAQQGGRMRPGPISHRGAEQRSAPAGCSTIPPRHRNRGAAWWYGPGPALTRGPSQDDLKIVPTAEATVGRCWPVAEVVRAPPYQTVLVMVALLWIALGWSSVQADGLLPPKPYNYLHPPAVLRRGNTVPTAGRKAISLTAGRSAPGFVFTRDGQAGVHLPAGAFVAGSPATSVLPQLQPVDPPPGLSAFRSDKAPIAADGNAYTVSMLGEPGNVPVRLVKPLQIILRWPYAPLAIDLHRAGGWRELCFADSATYTASTMSCSSSRLGVFLAMAPPSTALFAPATPAPTVPKATHGLAGGGIVVAVVIVLVVLFLLLLLWRSRRPSKSQGSGT